MAGQVMFPRPGGVVGNKYVLEAMLDSDATGAVFRARHSTTGRPFAIRWLTRPRPSSRPHPSSRPPSSEHATHLPLDESYQNPIVLSPVDVGRTPHGTYIVMEWLNGETLSSRIACEGALTLAAAAKVLVPCMRAVHEMHLAHAVHGDLRPGNIFICRGVEQHPESVRVFDYSIAGPACAPVRIDEHGEYTVDAHFLAPEQISHAAVDQRADVYAFGVLLYVSVTGQLPFTPDRTDDFARWIYSQDPPSLPGAPGLTPASYRFLARAMARDVEERFESCSELADQLEILAQQSQQPIVTVQRAHVVRSVRPTMRLASEQPQPLTAANDPRAPHPPRTGLPRSASASLPPPAAHARPTATSMPTVEVPPRAARAPGSSRPTATSMPTVEVPTIAARAPNPLRGTLAGMSSESLPPPAAPTKRASHIPGSLRATVQGMPITAPPARADADAGAAPLPGSLRPTPSRLPTISVPPRAARARGPSVPPPAAGSRGAWHPAGAPLPQGSRGEWRSAEQPEAYAPPPPQAAGARGPWRPSEATSREDDTPLSVVDPRDVWRSAQPPASFGSSPPPAAGPRAAWHSPAWHPPASQPPSAARYADDDAQMSLSMRPTAPVPVLQPSAAGAGRVQQPHVARRSFQPPAANQQQLGHEPAAAWPLPAAKAPGSFRPPRLEQAAIDPQLAATRELDVPRRSAPPAGSRPLRFSPPRSGSDRPLHDLQYPESETYESTVPLELMRPRERRRPLHRGVLLASACFALFGIIPTVAYFAPPLKDHDALSGGGAQPPSALDADNDLLRAAATQPPLPAASPTPAAPTNLPSLPNDISANAMNLPTPKPATTAPLVDDPTTPIDESDPLIAAALAAQESTETVEEPASAPVDEAPVDEAPMDEAPALSAKSKPTPAPTKPKALSAQAPKAASAPKAPIASPPARSTAPAPAPSARPLSPASLTAEPYKSMPTKRLPWEAPASRKAPSRSAH